LGHQRATTRGESQLLSRVSWRRTQMLPKRRRLRPVMRRRGQVIGWAVPAAMNSLSDTPTTPPKTRASRCHPMVAPDG
jgi:hypothetical protein